MIQDAILTGDENIDLLVKALQFFSDEDITKPQPWIAKDVLRKWNKIMETKNG